MIVRKEIGVGVIGFGWMGQAHSRSLARIASLFPRRGFNPRLVVCSDTVRSRTERALGDFGFAEVTDDWRRVVDHPKVDMVVVSAPNALHLEMVEAATENGKDVFCEKPVGATPDHTVLAELAVRRAGVLSAAGYNYRWMPMVLEAKQLIDDGRLGRITNYRGRFLSVYGADPLGPLSWRYCLDDGGHGASTDLLSHAVDLAHFLIGPISRVAGTTETFITERPLPGSGCGTHYDRGHPDDPKGQVTNEDYAAMMCIFDSGARGTFEASRAMVGPESQMAFEVYGTEGALAWNLERMNELSLFLRSDGRHAGYRTIFAGDRFPYHANFVPGNANGIGFEDAIVIEDFEWCRCLTERLAYHPGFDDAAAYVSVQSALLHSARSGEWEPVVDLRIG